MTVAGNEQLAVQLHQRSRLCMKAVMSPPYFRETTIVPGSATISPANRAFVVSSTKQRCPGSWPGVWTHRKRHCGSPTAHEHFAVVERAVDLERDLRSHGWMRRIGTAYRWRSASAEHVWSGCE